MTRFLPMLAGLAAILALPAACGTDTLNPVSESERQYGAEQHPRLLAQLGGAYPGEQARYLERLGTRLATAAGLEGQCTFTLVNTDVVNAFAVPGCYIYLTRGLFAIVNSEAELAAVLAHELGHIVADHSEQQQNRSLWRNLGVMAVGAITGSEELSRIANAAASFFTLRYSRQHEYEADDLGMGLVRKLGYDPFGASDMLEALARHEAFRAQSRGANEISSIPEWALTHPLTERRIARTRAAAGEGGIAPGTLPKFKEAYLRHVDGLLYGDDPEQGFVLGRRFAHPVMKIGFEAPPGFTLTNSPQVIMVEGPAGLMGEFSGGGMPAGGLNAYAEAVLGRFLRGARFQIIGSQQTRTNGGPALFVDVQVATRQGPATLSLAAYAGQDGAAYHFLMISPPGTEMHSGVGQLFHSFEFLTPEEVASLRPRQIRVMRVAPGETLETFTAQMASERPRDHFRMLNGMDDGRSLQAGEEFKLVEWRR